MATISEAGQEIIKKCVDKLDAENTGMTKEMMFGT